MRITVLTIFPEFFDSFLDSVLVKRAAERGLLEVEIRDIKDYADGSFRHIDDSPYGGGAGMIMRCEPLIGCLEAVKTGNSHTVMFMPGGVPYTQDKVHEYTGMDHLILICGHYEGIDARVNSYCDEFISVGDYVLSGGEIPAMAVGDSLARLLPGVLKEGSLEEESFSKGLLEYPQYTRPADYHGEKVPEVLLSGNHEAIAAWRREQAVELTRRFRPDLMKE